MVEHPPGSRHARLPIARSIDRESQDQRSDRQQTQADHSDPAFSDR